MQSRFIMESNNDTRLFFFRCDDLFPSYLCNLVFPFELLFVITHLTYENISLLHPISFCTILYVFLKIDQIHADPSFNGIYNTNFRICGD